MYKRQDILLGKFFLQSFKTDKNVTTMTCTDHKGRLDEYNFREGKVYNGELAGDVIDSIMQAAGIEEYTVCLLYTSETYQGGGKVNGL